MSFLTKSVDYKDRIHWRGVFALVLAIFLGMTASGIAVNTIQMVVDYEVTAYTSRAFLQWQDDQIKKYEQENPGSHPSTKDFPGNDERNL
jgi:hypothetical protein